MALIANSFALDATDTQETKRRLTKAAEAARRVPVFDLHYPRNYASIPEVHEQILATAALAGSEESPT